MAFERISVKKVYYYVICAVTLFILLWGAVDVVGSVFSLTVFKGPSAGIEMPSAQAGGMGAEKGVSESMVDEYYQSRMAFDRLGDSAARLLVAGLVFLYSSFRIRELEAKEI